MKNIPEEYHDLLQDERKAFAVLATIMDDGTPQATPVWFSYDGEHILLNSVKGRIKDRNMRARPQIALTIFDPADMYRFVQVRGRVVEMTEAGGWNHIHYLAQTYMGVERWEHGSPEDVRVIYKVVAE